MNTDQTAFLDSHMQWIVEAGEITVGGKTRGFYAKSNIVD